MNPCKLVSIGWVLPWLTMATLAGQPLAATASPAPLPTSAEMTAKIDALVSAAWRQHSVQSAEMSSDAEFLRRVTLDLTGVIPRVSDARRFLEDTSADKRARLIDQLLQSPAHATHLSVIWRNIMLPGGFDQQRADSAAGLQRWFRRQFAENMRYDRIVSDFLVTTGRGEAGPALYYTSLQLQPERLAASSARIFLGVQLECAQCHDHPFDRWTQAEFWGYAAFFARLRGPTSNRPMEQVGLVDASEGEVTLPNTDTVVSPKYPNGPLASEQDGGTRRVQLSIWMASRDNPYLARAAVNRVWAQLFGRGLVEPLDDMGPHNPASHPELLDSLAAYFARSGFDYRQLYRVLTNTQVYQLASRTKMGQEIRPELFQTMAVKTITPHALYNCLERILPHRGPAGAAPSPGAGGLLDPRRQAFIAKLQAPADNAAKFHASVLLALAMMNGAEISQATDPQRSGLLTAIQAPFLSNRDRLDILFLATLSRHPSQHEQEELLEYVGLCSSGQASQTAFSDVLWALLNSAEFRLNH